MEIPDFLKPLDPNSEKPRLVILINEYEKLYGRTWSTAGWDFSDEELTEIFETCIKQKRTFSDVIGWNNKYLDPDDDI